MLDENNLIDEITIERTEKYIYKNEQYHLRYSKDVKTEFWTCITKEEEERFKQLYQSNRDLHFLSFTNEPDVTYIFDTESELKTFNWKEAPKRLAEYFERHPKVESSLRSTDDWLIFYKDCGNQSIKLCAPDHVSHFEDRVSTPSLQVCSAVWEQADLGSVSMPNPPGGNWDQAISRFAIDPAEFPLDLSNFNAVLDIIYFRGINFDGTHRCRNKTYSVVSNFVSACLTDVDWGFWCDDMNDSISSWRAVYCTTLPCDGGCFDTGI